MNYTIYGIRDLKAQAFDQNIISGLNDQMIIREFRSLIARKSPGLINQIDYPEDFQLFALGTFDRSTGKLVSEQRHICDFTALVEKDDKSV